MFYNLLFNGSAMVSHSVEKLSIMMILGYTVVKILFPKWSYVDESTLILVKQLSVIFIAGVITGGISLIFQDSFSKIDRKYPNLKWLILVSVLSWSVFSHDYYSSIVAVVSILAFLPVIGLLSMNLIVNNPTPLKLKEVSVFLIQIALLIFSGMTFLYFIAFKSILVSQSLFITIVSITSIGLGFGIALIFDKVIKKVENMLKIKHVEILINGLYFIVYFVVLYIIILGLFIIKPYA